MAIASRPASPSIPSRLIVPAVAGVALLLLSGCVGPADPGAAAGDTLRIVLPSEPPTLEACDSPLTSIGIVTRSNVTEPLIERNPTTGELEPLLATAWEATGEREWTITMREGVTFHDGTPFTAASAAFTIDRDLHHDLDCSVEGTMFADEEVEAVAVDDTTLKVTTGAPDPLLPLRLSFVEVVPESTSLTEKVREPIGTGPYSIGTWESGQRIELNRFDDYWGDAPAYANATYEWRAEGTVRAAMVTNGEADLALALGPDDGAGDLGVPYQNNETVVLRLSGDIAPLNDIRVRQAINYAIDKESIVESLYNGLGEVAAQLVPHGIVGHNDDLQPWPYDLDEAKALVEAAAADGVPVDQKITIIGRTAQFPKVNELIEVLQEQMNQIGLNAEIKMVDSAQSLEYELRPFVTDEGAIAYVQQHGNSAGDAMFTVGRFMGSDASGSTIGTPELDAMIADAALKSGQERQDAYAAIFAYQNENVVQYVHLVHMSGVIAKSASVDYTPDQLSSDEIRLSEITPAG